jgi:hypothetical protein
VKASKLALTIQAHELCFGGERPERLELTAEELADLQLDLVEGGGSGAVYSGEPPKMPDGAVMMFMGVPVFRVQK